MSCITHHHACKCREAEFAKVTAERNDRELSLFLANERIDQLEAENKRLGERVAELEKLKPAPEFPEAEFSEWKDKNLNFHPAEYVSATKGAKWGWDKRGELG